MHWGSRFQLTLCGFVKLAVYDKSIAGMFRTQTVV